MSLGPGGWPSARATCLDDLKVPPGNRLHELERDRKGQYSIAVNDQWRVCFRFVDGDAYDVEVADYHFKTELQHIKPLRVARQGR